MKFLYSVGLCGYYKSLDKHLRQTLGAYDTVLVPYRNLYATFPPTILLGKNFLIIINLIFYNLE